MHQKRLAISKLWPIPKKGRTFIVRTRGNKKLGMPVLVAMRDVLGHVQKRKELKKIMLEDKVHVNGSPIRDDKYSLDLFDNLSLPSIKKHYKVSLSSSGKISFEEGSEKDSSLKIVKVVGKKILSKGLIQLNMQDGRNIISKEKVSVGDSVLLNMKDKKIEKVLPIKEKSEVIVIKGKHLGNKGKVSKVSEHEVSVSLDEGEYNLNKNAVIALS
jgi:small subunit ribosomal protein S4e